MLKTLLIQPPLTQLNTAYPAIAQLTGFLKAEGYAVAQMDLSIELVNALFTRHSLCQVFGLVGSKKLSKNTRQVFSNAPLYLKTIEPAMRFLSGSDTTLSTRICSRNFLPEGKHFKHIDDLEWAFGTLGDLDRAKYLCTLYLQDLCSLITEAVDPHFELVRYAQKLCTYLPEFDDLQAELDKGCNFVDQLMLQLLTERIEKEQPNVVGFSVPFPGNLYAALRCAKMLKDCYPHIAVVMGGGYVNTELRQLSDARLFKYIDYLLYDDGELPLLRLLEHLHAKTHESKKQLLRTAYMDGNKLVFSQFSSSENVAFAQLPAPCYADLLSNRYINLVEQTNPMHHLWSNGRWNKLMLAHGCYWAKCAFCDTSLDYIKRYEAAPAKVIVDRMEQLMKQTGESGFHFVDEAAPPALLRQLAEEIISRGLVVSYWTNVRFDKAFTPELCYLLASSGCIAVSGGLEVASDRVLQLINKGISLDSAHECLANLSNAGIMVHAYLMYGFPSQTMAETVESLEVVRQLFEQGLLQSAFWHQYAMTVHSPSGQHPEAYGAKHIPHPVGSFANNEIPFEDNTDIVDFEAVGAALHLATYNYMQGLGFDVDVRKWFG